MLAVTDIAPYLREHRTAVISLGVILFFIILFVVLHKENGDEQSGPRYVPPTDTDWVLGDVTKAKSTLIVYSDFACPSCDTYHSLLAQLYLDLNGDLAIIYRHFPITSSHQNAGRAAEAAEAAGLEGKFFEMANVLFSSRNDWGEIEDPEELFSSYAVTIGIPKESFLKNFLSDDTKETILNAEEDARALGLRMAPSFFLDGTYIPTPKTPAELKTKITEKLYGGK